MYNAQCQEFPGIVSVGRMRFSTTNMTSYIGVDDDIRASFSHPHDKGDESD